MFEDLNPTVPTLAILLPMTSIFFWNALRPLTPAFNDFTNDIVFSFSKGLCVPFVNCFVCFNCCYTPFFLRIDLLVDVISLDSSHSTPTIKTNHPQHDPLLQYFQWQRIHRPASDKPHQMKIVLFELLLL